MQYFSLEWSHTPEGSSAFALWDKVEMNNVLIGELNGKTSMPFDFVLKKWTEKKNGLLINDNLDGLQNIWDDYLPNELAGPSCQRDLKRLLKNAFQQRRNRLD